MSKYLLTVKASPDNAIVTINGEQLIQKYIEEKSIVTVEVSAPNYIKSSSILEMQDTNTDLIVPLKKNQNSGNYVGINPIDISSTNEISIEPATNSQTGSMSAEDKGYLDLVSKVYITSGTANAYIISIPGITSYIQIVNKPIYIKFHVASSSSTINININNLGNIRLYLYETTTPGSSYIKLGQIETILYNGTNFLLVDPIEYAKLGINSVTYGGTGKNSNTINALIAGGTTVSGALQSVTNGATSGMLLKSNGTTALPTFETIDNLGISTKSELNNVVINSVVQPQGQIYLTSGTGTSNGSFSLVEPTTNQTYPTTVSTTPTLRNTFTYTFPQDGIISTLSSWQLILRLTNLSPQQTYNILGNIILNTGGVDTTLSTLSNFTFQTGNSQTSMEVTLPFMQNTLLTNKSYVSGSTLRVTLTWNKSNGGQETINIQSISTNPVTFVRNGGEIGSTLVIDNNGINTKTLAERLRDIEAQIAALQP